MKSTLRKTKLGLAAVSFLKVLVFGSAFSQPSATNQVLKLQVVEVNNVAVEEYTLNVPPASLESPYKEGSIFASTRFTWTSNSGSRKIGLKSEQASGENSLLVTMKHIQSSDGVFEEQVELSDNSTHDFVRALSKSAGGCTLFFSLKSGGRQENPVRSWIIVYTTTGS